MIDRMWGRARSRALLLLIRRLYLSVSFVLVSRGAPEKRDDDDTVVHNIIIYRVILCTFSSSSPPCLPLRK